MVASRIAMFVIILWLIGKVLAFGKDLLVSYYFGASIQTDAYFIASNIPSLVYAGLLATVPLVLLPLYSKKIAEGHEGQAYRFASSVLNWYVAAALVFTVVVFTQAEFLVASIAPTVTPSTAALAVTLTKIFSATFVFSMASAVFTTIQLSNKQALGVQLIPIFNNGLFVLGVFLFSSQYGIYAAAVSATVAWMVQIPLQALFIKGKYKYSSTWMLDKQDRRALFIVFFPALIGVSIEQLNPIVSIYFGSSLAEGSVSMLSYAFRLISFCTGVFIVITSTISFPAFADKVSGKKLVELIEHIYQNTRLTLFTSIFVALVLSFFSRDVVSVILERGQLSADHADTVAELLSVLALSIPFVALREVYIRGIYAFSEAKLGMLTGVIALFANIIICYLFIHVYGIQAISVATVAAAFASCIVSFLLLHKIFGMWPTLHLLTFVLRLAIVVVVTISVLVGFFSYFLIESALVKLVIGVVLASFAYLVTSVLVGIIRINFSRRTLESELFKS